MCGIAGFLSPSIVSAWDLDVRNMTDALHHRGPDDSGVWVDGARGIALGHRRLSIIDPTASGSQPMRSPSGRYHLVFNGEIYNHLKLREQLDLAAKGPTVWQGHSDTEMLLAYIDAWGFENAIREAKGMFALAVWDKKKQSLMLARDRMGEKPLYYGWQGSTFLFGSELKALKAHPSFAGNIDRGALTLFLRHNFIPAPYSIYEGISKLPAGTWLEVDPSDKERQPVHYWKLSEVAEQGVASPFPGNDEDALAQLENHMLKTVQGQMMSDVPLGALLSGGIDSSLVSALMQANSSQPIKTFTVGFSEKQYNEAPHARAVARHLGTDHTELMLSADDALGLVPRLSEIWDEPFADSSQLPTYFVMKLARDQVTVALSGDGGDELFGGYNRYHHVPRMVKRLGWLPGPLRRSAGTILTSIPASALNASFGPWALRNNISLPGDKAHKLGQKLRNVNFDNVDDLYVSLLVEWHDATDVVLGGYLPPNPLDDRASWPQIEDPVTRMMTMDGLVYLPDDILVKVDRAAMAVSLETRAPFLDCDLIEFAAHLPIHFKQRDGQGKWLLRRLLDRYIPRELIERPKMGFAIPLDDWLRGPLRDWAEDLLAKDRLEKEGFFKPALIRDAWEKHSRGRANYGYKLWSILMFQSWLETNA